MLAFAACHVKRRNVKRSQRGLTSVLIAKRLLRFGPNFDLVSLVPVCIVYGLFLLHLACIPGDGVRGRSTESSHIRSDIRFLARNKLFGVGLYFADHAIKADQYATTDRHWTNYLARPFAIIPGNAASSWYRFRTRRTWLHSEHSKHSRPDYRSCCRGTLLLQGAIYYVLRRCPLSSNVLSDLGNPLVQSRMNRLVANRDKEIDPVILGGEFMLSRLQNGMFIVWSQAF